MKKITLIKAEPKNTNVYSTFSYPGLALPVLGTVLKQKGYDVRIYVESIQPWDWSRILESDLVGLTVNSAESRESYELACAIRAKTSAPIVMGGYHVTYMAEEALDYCDYVVRGEGEETFAELADELVEGHRRVEGILGISYRHKGQVVHNPDRPLLQDIDLIPDQALIAGYRDYHRRFFQRVFPTGALVASSRGCPYDCTFCSIIEIYKRTTRYRSPEAVIEDIRQQTALTGRPYVFFVDDNFTAHQRKCKDLLRHLIDADLNIRFSAQVRLEFSQDEEFIRLMKEAGCYMVFVGLESINPQTLEDFRKRQTVDEVRHCIERLRREKIHVHGMFVFGGDADDVETCRNTARFAVEQGLGSAQFMPLYPIPGTVQTTALRQAGRLLQARNPVTGREEVAWGAGNFVLFQPYRMKPAELQWEVLQAYESFYSWRNILASLFGGGPLLSAAIKVIGHRLLRQGRQQVLEHMHWLKKNGFHHNVQDADGVSRSPFPRRKSDHLDESALLMPAKARVPT